MLKKDFYIILLILSLCFNQAVLGKDISTKESRDLSPIEVLKSEPENLTENNNLNESVSRLECGTSMFEMVPLEEVQLDVTGIQFNSRLNYHLNNRPIVKSSLSDKQKNLFSANVNSNSSNTIYLGQTKILVGPKEARSKVFLNAVNKSQAAKNKSSDDLSMKIGWDWEFLDYSLNAANQEDKLTGDGKLTTGGQVAIKPLYKYPELGNLEIGGGYNTDPNSVIKQNAYSFFTGYKAGKYAIKGGYSREDNYGSKKGFSDNWFVSNALSLTDNINIIARHNELDFRQRLENDLVFEYSVKEVPFLRISNLRIQINASYIQHIILDDTQRAGMYIKYSF
ncbi:MAG: hypothetical protein A2104_04585 [Candidatus Melainabacteria bacterium GWF2_32_7]|nr:MAG: hypothetical protein A2104_04585 [Candidatus Melainabacteria bacterium GWF2_32_7]